MYACICVCGYVCKWASQQSIATTFLYIFQVNVFRVLCNLYSTRSIQIMDHEQHQTLLNHSITCMLSLPCTTCTHYVSVQLVAAGILEFLAYNTEHLDNPALYKVRYIFTYKFIFLLLLQDKTQLLCGSNWHMALEFHELGHFIHVVCHITMN